jgi:hypothetical protein
MQALPLHKAFLAVYQQALLTNIKDMLSVASLMVQLSPSSSWAEAMHASEFFARLLATLIEDKAKNDNTLVLVEVINLFARMIMQDSAVFVQLVALSSSILNKPAEYLMNGFLDQWWAKVCCLASHNAIIYRIFSSITSSIHQDVNWLLWPQPSYSPQAIARSSTASHHQRLSIFGWMYWESLEKPLARIQEKMMKSERVISFCRQEKLTGDHLVRR